MRNLEILRVDPALRSHPTPIVFVHGAREAFFSATLSAEQVKAYWARLQDESYFAFLDRDGSISQGNMLTLFTSI